jgi:predicted permease
MLAIVLSAVLPVLITAGLGFIWARYRAPLPSQQLAPLITEVATPCLVISTFMRTELTLEAFGAAILGAVTATLLFLAGGYYFLRFSKLRVRTFLPPICFPNMGNLGLPLALYAFGTEGLSYAIVFFTVSSVGNFTIGQAIASGTVNWRGLVRLPLIYAAPVGLALSITGATLPAWLANTINLIGGMTIPLMLLMLGMSLGSLGVVHLRNATIVSAFRILYGTAVGVAVALAFGFEGTLFAGCILACSMPSAVYNYVFAQRWNSGAEDVASVVVISTLMAVATIPLILSVLIPLVR